MGPVERAAGAREPPGAQAVAQGVGAAAQARVGSTSTGVGASPGASSVKTTGQTNRANTTVNEAVSPNNPSTTTPGGPNSQPVPNQTVQEQNARQFDPRLSPGYQK